MRLRLTLRLKPALSRNKMAWPGMALRRVGEKKKIVEVRRKYGKNSAPFFTVR